MPFGVLWNSTGQPAASVPAGFAADGPPARRPAGRAPARRGDAADAFPGDRGCAPVGTSPSRGVRLVACRRRMAGCRICSGDLELKVQGNGATVTAAALSPSAHAVGGHGDLLVCTECGTVQQPILPARRGAARPLPRHARRRLPQRGGGPARDREPPARPDRRARARGRGCWTSAAGTACCSTRRAGAATRRSGWSCPARRARHARSLGPRRARVPLESFCEGSNGDSPGEFDASCSPTCSSTSTIRSPRSTTARACCAPAACCASSRRTRRARPPGSPARAGGAICPRTPSCCRAGRCAS